MRKPRRLTVEPERPVHLIQRGNNRRRLFSYPTDYGRLLQLISLSAAANRCRIHALCLMSNHIHMLVHPPSCDALSQFVKQYAQPYATARNQRRQGSGKLFEERFHSPPIKSESHFMATLLYIDRNPVDAGIKRDAADYPWSTYRLHAGLPNSKLPSRIWTPSAWYLELGGTAGERAAAYRAAYASYDESKLSDAQRRLIARLETAAYTRRLERPDRTRAHEAAVRYRAQDGIEEYES